LQAERRQGGELLFGRLLVGRFVGKAAQHDLRIFRHKGTPKLKKHE